MAEDVFLLALPSLVNFYSLERHFIVYEKNITLQLLLKRSLEKAFSTKAKTPHIVQEVEDCLLCPERAELSLPDFPQLKFRFSPHINCE